MPSVTSTRDRKHDTQVFVGFDTASTTPHSQQYVDGGGNGTASLFSNAAVLTASELLKAAIIFFFWRCKNLLATIGGFFCVFPGGAPERR